MNENLVKRLRDKASALDYDGWVDTAASLEEAADAIEELIEVIQNHDFLESLMKPDWVPVTERLPEEWKSVLTYQPYKNDREKPLIRISWYIGAGIWRECEQANTLELPVTHWMSLPEPPKGEV